MPSMFLDAVSDDLRRIDQNGPGGTYTFCAWINLSALPSANHYICTYVGAGTYDIYITGAGFVGMWDNASPTVESSAIQLNRWYHVAVVFQSGTNASGLYIDGVNVGNTTAATFSAAATDDFHIGFASTESALIRISALKIFTAALTLNEIKAEMQQNTPNRKANLWGWWPLWNGADANDYSGNGRHFTLNGTPTTSPLSPPIRMGDGFTNAYRSGRVENGMSRSESWT